MLPWPALGMTDPDSPRRADDRHVVLAAGLAAEAGGRWLVAAAVATATVLSTGRVEVAAQALVVAVVLARPGRDRHRWGRVIAAGALGAFLASPTLMAMRAAIDESRRGAGLDLAVMLARSVHPISLVQTLVGKIGRASCRERV